MTRPSDRPGSTIAAFKTLGISGRFGGLDLKLGEKCLNPPLGHGLRASEGRFLNALISEEGEGLGKDT